jgi:hypothetical protein
MFMGIAKRRELRVENNDASGLRSMDLRQARGATDVKSRIDGANPLRPHRCARPFPGGTGMKNQPIFMSRVTDERGDYAHDHHSFTVIEQRRGPVNPFDGSSHLIEGSGDTPIAVLEVPDDARLAFDAKQGGHILIVPSEGQTLLAEEALLWFGPYGLRTPRRAKEQRSVVPEVHRRLDGAPTSASYPSTIPRIPAALSNRGNSRPMTGPPHAAFDGRAAGNHRGG